MSSKFLSGTGVRHREHGGGGAEAGEGCVQSGLGCDKRRHKDAFHKNGRHFGYEEHIGLFEHERDGGGFVAA